MDFVQNGESSRSPRPNGDTDIAMNEEKKPQSTLILPEWDVPPNKPLHASLDLISLLHLDTLYNTYVRPYADLNPDDHVDGEPGENGIKSAQRHRRRKLDKGYWHLIEDCIDPTPTGTKLDNQSLLPLSQDYMHPPGHPLNIYSGDIEMLPNDAFQSAKLEAGHKEDGYSKGEKLGVKEAEERRKKKRAAKLSIAPTSDKHSSPALPSPGIANSNSSQIQHQTHVPSTPGTPLLPVAPPQRFPFNQNQPYNRKLSNAPQSGVRPFPSGQGRPYAPNPNKRPSSVEAQGTQKRVKSGSVGPSGSGSGNKPNGMGSRSASPMPQFQGPGQGQNQGQKKYKSGMRSMTEGV
ncbi:uncharacterized protein IL334_002873 [Kwoniella shivajii]|uniref:Mediator of RNA polymerase II transcription subunit 19 n=1 Tax=Kwoniella shivajii TaxID=564305 RepID=A0ABZ1D040_9TREE|nr:hypothetical protein IL334_002873 [Kwoniella shivajii]